MGTEYPGTDTNTGTLFQEGPRIFGFALDNTGPIIDYTDTPYLVEDESRYFDVTREAPSQLNSD